MTPTYEDRRKVRMQQAAWRRECDHLLGETRGRFREVLARLGVAPEAAPAVLDALMATARYYSMECSYANYELRTGCVYPPERREAEEEQERIDWIEALERLDGVLTS